MNKIKFIFASIFVFTVLILSSCTNEPIDPAIDLTPVSPSNPGVAVFSVNFDSQTYVGMQVDAVIADGQILINAFKLPGLESFSIAIDGTTTGSYLANENFVSYSPGLGFPEVYVSVNPVDLEDNTGQITITEINTVSKTISGTFNFTGYYMNPPAPPLKKIFTGGIFTNIPYTAE